MQTAARDDLLGLASARASTIASSAVANASFRLDAGAFIGANGRASAVAAMQSGQVLSDLANVFTVYIQTPVLYYVEPFAQSRPYLTTSELGEYQRGVPTHVSLVTDPRLIEWEVGRDQIVLSRSGRVGEAYWIDKKLAGTLVGDSFRVVPRSTEGGYLLYAILSSQYAKDYMTGVSYGSVVSHASVEHARSLPLPKISNGSRARIVDLVRRALAARDSAYDLLDEASADLFHANGLPALAQPHVDAFDPLGQPDTMQVKARSVVASNGDGSEYRLDAHFHNRAAQDAVANIRRSRSKPEAVKDVAERVLMGPRFKRNYVESTHGVPFLSGKNIVQIRPTDLKYLSNLQMAEMQELVVKRAWTLITCSGTIGRTCFVWKNYEDYAASQHVLRVMPNESAIDPGYLYAFLSSQYGYEQILRYRHGSVIDEVTDKQIEHVLVPVPQRREQEAIGDKVREAYEKRAEAIRLEDEAQAILLNEMTNAQKAKGA